MCLVNVRMTRGRLYPSGLQCLFCQCSSRLLHQLGIVPARLLCPVCCVQFHLPFLLMSVAPYPYTLPLCHQLKLSGTVSHNLVCGTL